MSLLSRVFGWAPPGNAEYIEVPLHVQQPLHGPENTGKFNQVSCAAASAGTSGLNIQSTTVSSIPPSSLLEPVQYGSYTGFDSASTGNTSKNTNPTWVARPRNKFILFRCDYVRKHSRDEKRDSVGGEAEKSLSKQAAEAWHRLSKEERLYWKECATGERIEHARRYPNYRFRPKKSTMMRRYQERPSTNNSEAKSSSKTITQIINNTHPQSSLGSSINRSPPKHMLSVINPTPGRPSYVPHSAVGDSSDKPLRSTPSLSIPGTSPSPNIGSPYSNQHKPATIPLPSCSQTWFNAPQAELNNVLTQTNPSTPISSINSSFSNWNGGNMVQPFGSGSSSDVSMSGLSQISLSSLDLQRYEYTTGETQFALPPSDSLHHQQQQFDDGLYQPAEIFWISYPIANNGGTVQMAQNSFSAAYTHAQHTFHDGPCAAPSIPNGFYETMTFAGVGGTSNCRS